MPSTPKRGKPEVGGSLPSGGTVQIIPLVISEDEKMFQEWFSRTWDEVHRRVYTDLRVPKRFLA